MEILTIEAYEIGNGIEVRVEDNGEQFNAYLQLPDCADSQHSFTDGNHNDGLLAEIVEFVGGKFTGTQLSVLTQLGTLDYEIREANGAFQGYFVAVNKNDVEDYIFLTESNYNSYYNMYALIPATEKEEYLRDKSISNKLNECLGAIVSSLELEKVLVHIKAINDKRSDNTTISDDATNEELVNIFRVCVNDDIEDTEDSLSDYFGQDGFHEIREAEKGCYS